MGARMFAFFLMVVFYSLVNADVGLEYEYSGIRVFTQDAAKTVLCTVEVDGKPFQFTIDEVKGNKFLEVISPPMRYQDAQTGACVIENQVNNWVQKIENEQRAKANLLQELNQKQDLLKQIDRSKVKFEKKFIAARMTVEENQCFITEISCSRDRPKANQNKSPVEAAKTHTWKIGIDRSDIKKWFSPGKQCTLSVSVEDAIRYVLEYRLSDRRVARDLADFAVAPNGGSAASNLGKIVVGFLAVVSDLINFVLVSDNVSYKNGADTLFKTDVCHLIKLMKQNKDVANGALVDRDQKADLNIIGNYSQWILNKVTNAPYLREATKEHNIAMMNDFIRNLGDTCLNLRMQQDITKFNFPLNGAYVVLYELRSGCSFESYNPIFSGINMAKITPVTDFSQRCGAKKKRKFYKK